MAADQLSKYVARQFFPYSVIYNEGVAFSLPTPAWLVVLIFGALLGILIWNWSEPLFRHRRVVISLGLVLGGALSNLVDRVLRGAVLDFIDLQVWPVFNVADVAIIVGVSMFVWYAWHTSPTSHGTSPAQQSSSRGSDRTTL